MLIELPKAIDLLKSGQPVIIPTETVYGLAADATSDLAIAKIYESKRRPAFNPLIIHVPSIESIAWATISPLALRLMREFWLNRGASISFALPLKAKHPLSKLALAGLDTVAVRRPNHEIALNLLESLPFPLAAPSANRSNRISPTSAELALASLGEAIPALDGGSCEIGLESTVAAPINDKIEILRLGSVTLADLAAFGETKIADHGKAIKAPGMLKRHYAPNHDLFLNVTDKTKAMFLVGFGEINGDLNLSPLGDLNEAARNLFRYLHLADGKTTGTIGVAPIPNHGLGAAINDRLRRASAPA